MSNYSRKLALFLFIALSAPALADEPYTLVYDAYRASIAKVPDSYQSWLDAGSQRGVFDKVFFQCLSVLQSSWFTESKSQQDICAGLPNGGRAKLECQKGDVAGDLWLWGRDVRAVLSGQAQWADTFTGRQRVAGRQMCRSMPGFCEQLIQQTLIMTDRMVRPKALCTMNN